MKIEAFVFDPSEPNSPQLKLAFKRYSRDDSTGCNPSGALSLLLAHGSALHKEQWEPTIEALFAIQDSCSRRALVHEAWAVDWQSHGESAVINDNALQDRPEGISISEWGFALSQFMSSAHTRNRRIVAIGHSAGCSAIMYSTKYLLNGPNSYAAIILVEPPMIDRDVFNDHLQERLQQVGAITKSVAASRASWSTKEEALKWLSAKYPWKTWDPRVLRLFVEHGLREHRDDGGRDCVVVKCSKKHEASAYKDFESTFEATDMISAVCRAVPLHIIFGAKNDLVPRYSQDSLVDASKGRVPQSITRLPGAGHLVVQEKPELLAEALAEILDTLVVSDLSRL
ncbi:alpha/beta-hydrolase [Dichomitus squalens]|uniref:Alpha/beta-hydrolase n=1 Tax=Dichomitus squalens TaxID=114155 RepID=A0A4Q9NTZ6_9APHY|nr:alpha/beta-hydrolase [Dichomitus squalens]TBU58576.1 alpha/beta-hydrolase [Dichomitus squalens]